jgi:diguanylate cyclase (GGDEF)-like protein
MPPTILDIDHFKAINDQFDHTAGDAALCDVAASLRACCRAIDTPARYGGDEFMLILPETDLRGAEELAERIRAQIKSLTNERQPGLLCTVSLGGAVAGPVSTTSMRGFSARTLHYTAPKPKDATASKPQRLSLHSS